jgi:PAS domain S-box-containing protein
VPAKIEVKLLLDEVLAATIDLQKADLGCVHLCNPVTLRPEMIALRGLSQELIASFGDADSQRPVWSSALAEGRRVAAVDISAEDVRADASFALYRAFQATPLFGRDGKPLGVISTFFREPHRWTDQELRFSDLHALLAVKLIERQRAEEALRESEARYRSVLRNLPAAVYTCDATGRVTLFNDAAVALWGRTPDLARDEWCGSYKMYHLDGRPMPLDMCPMAISLKEGRALSGEAIVERPDGTRRQVRAYPQPIRDTSGSLAGAVNLVLDITDYKNTQEALRESKDRFRRYFELGLIGMATTSPDKGVLEVNDELCRILGYERAELLQKSWAELTHPDDLAADVAQFNRVMAGEFDSYALDKRWIRRDGQVIDSIMAAKCQRRPDGSVDYFVGLVQDITARKRAETESAALKNALAADLHVMTRLHEFSTRLLANTEVQPLLEEVLSAVIAIQNADFGILQLYNPEYSLEIVAQQGFQQDLLMYFADVHDETTACGRALKQHRRVIIEDVDMDAGFEPHRASAASAGFRAVQATPLFGRSGEQLGAISTQFRTPHRPTEHELRLTDLYAVHAAQIIERERNRAVLLHYQQELRALTARLIDLQETQNRDLARELHDAFSQELAVLGIEMAALAQGPPESFETISARLRRFTEQIGGLSKYIHQISRQLHPAILHDLGLEAALKNECLIFATQHGTTTEFDGADIPRNIPDDVALCLYRVTQECLRNVARHANAASVRVTLRAGRNEIALEIVDNGDGFDPEKIKSKGRLGLISVDERCRLVNGEFSVRSERGKGTRVKVRVPLEERALTMGSTIKAKDNRPSVLLADDHQIVVEGLRRVLETDFNVVGTVADGLALIEDSKKLNPDVIVADISMPLMNGIEAARQIQKIGLSAKIVFLSMHPDIVYVSEALRAGGLAYVLKSSAGIEIVNAIREVLQGRTYVTPCIDKSALDAQIKRDDSSPDKLQGLSPRLREVLQMTAEGNSAKKIAEILKISPRTVEFHRYRAMEALDLHTIAELVQYAIKHRLIDPTDGSCFIP